LEKLEIKSNLRKFIEENYLPSAGIDSFEDGDSFMEKGIIDSTGILELLEFLESTFQIRVEDDEVIPDNLDTLTCMTVYVRDKLQNVAR
jgi:acyl carrier protein